MKTLKKMTISCVLLLVTVAFSASVSAQEKSEGVRPSFESGPYEFNLGLTAGYRNSDVTDFDGNKSDWATKRFNEMYNLRSGLNLNSFSLFGERKGDPGFFDELYVNAFG